jgi:cytochrome c-type biogenesis protein CcmH
MSAVRAAYASALALVAAAFLPAAILAAPGDAAEPEQALSDPALEGRAMSLAREIRCVVCENEPVALSSAEIAVDMRQAIRERVAAGDTDSQVRDYFASRYGEFVLLRPRVGPATLALWALPVVLLLLGALALFLLSRRGGAGGAVPGDPVEDAAARAALDRLSGSGPG